MSQGGDRRAGCASRYEQKNSFLPVQSYQVTKGVVLHGRDAIPPLTTAEMSSQSETASVRHSDRAPLAVAPVEPLLSVALCGLLLLGMRLLAGTFSEFITNDSSALAAGAAALLRGNDGDIYRYGPQFGYYQLVVGLTRLVGGSVMSIPVVMVALSCVASTIIPLAGLYAFRADLSRHERWIAAAVLATSPVIWWSARYPNSPLPSVAMAVMAVTILSNRPNAARELLALALFVGAILIRADAVLVSGAVALILLRNHRQFRPAAVRMVALAGMVACIYAIAFASDSRMRSMLGDIEAHLTNIDETYFWTYLLFSVSPFPFIFAILGFREMMPERRWLLLVLAALSLPVLAFYFASTTQPRYFLLPSFAIALASAVGMSAIVQLVPRHRRLAVAAVASLASVHLFVGLSRFSPGSRHGWLYQSTLATQEGPMWTGALLFKSYGMLGHVRPSVFAPAFGRQLSVERSLRQAFAELSSAKWNHRHVVLLIEVRFSRIAHFFAQAAGMQIVSKQPGPIWDKPFELTLGGARLSMIGWLAFSSDTTLVVPARTGDEVWAFGFRERELSDMSQRMPPGLTLMPDTEAPIDPYMLRFRVQPAAGTVAAPSGDAAAGKR